jgi:hypothetical protein
LTLTSSWNLHWNIIQYYRCSIFAIMLYIVQYRDPLIRPLLLMFHVWCFRTVWVYYESNWNFHNCECRAECEGGEINPVTDQKVIHSYSHLVWSGVQLDYLRSLWKFSIRKIM